MQFNSIYRQISALFLVALVFQVVALKELHHLFEHHDKVAHCNTEGAQSHLHSEEYAPDGCQICFFNFAPATLEFQEFTVQTPVCEALHKIFFYHKTLTSRVNWHFQHRGPPCLPA
ncbi:MAG: hypothetical protein GC192_00315 [Bacteroidetes bacterium]|nr:hypothetical protein [Bacteroidota bacterium]